MINVKNVTGKLIAFTINLPETVMKGYNEESNLHSDTF